MVSYVSLRTWLRRKSPGPDRWPLPGQTPEVANPNQVGQDEVFEFHGFHIPVGLIELTGGGPETFEQISTMHIKNLMSQHPLGEGMSVLELGCGIGRDAIPLIEIIGSSGTYVGVDIIKASIEWCTGAITSRHPNFRYYHYDIRDSLHNPGGRLAYDRVELPSPDSTVDLAFAQSVFTHMLPGQFIHFLRELARCTRTAGTIYITCFRVDDQILSSARSHNQAPGSLRFEHYLGDGCYVNELEHLTGAVAYTGEALDRMTSAAGLRRRGPVRPGAWSGFFPTPFDGQDVLVLEHT
jgi:SAM-dependent methyltransferase